MIDEQQQRRQALADAQIIGCWPLWLPRANLAPKHGERGERSWRSMICASDNSNKEYIFVAVGWKPESMSRTDGGVEEPAVVVGCLRPNSSSGFVTVAANDEE